MYFEECLTRERHQERLRQAQRGRAARQAAELRKLAKRQARAERELRHAWQRVERLRALMRRASRPPADNGTRDERGPSRPRYPPGYRRAGRPGSRVPHRITSARNAPSHSSWHSTPIPAVDTRWIST